ncbi:MAG: PqqD family protein [Bacteroidales bacterium]|nr:PqqD family protein [Bacteroidales bacterium]
MKIRNNIAVSESGFLFDSNTGDSYSLNETGKQIVKMLNENKSEEEIRKYFLENYDIEEGTFENNFYDFINMLSKLNLLENEQ